MSVLLAELSRSFVRESALGGIHMLYRLGAALRRRRSAACSLRGLNANMCGTRHVFQPGVGWRAEGGAEALQLGELVGFAPFRNYSVHILEEQKHEV